MPSPYRPIRWHLSQRKLPRHMCDFRIQDSRNKRNPAPDDVLLNRQGSGNGKQFCYLSELSHDFAAILAVKSMMEIRVHAVAQKTHRAITQQCHRAARVITTRSEESGPVCHYVRDSTIGRQIAIRHAVDGTCESPGDASSSNGRALSSSPVGQRRHNLGKIRVGNHPVRVRVRRPRSPCSHSRIRSWPQT